MCECCVCMCDDIDDVTFRPFSRLKSLRSIIFYSVRFSFYVFAYIWCPYELICVFWWMLMVHVPLSSEKLINYSGKLCVCLPCMYANEYLRVGQRAERWKDKMTFLKSFGSLWKALVLLALTWCIRYDIYTCVYHTVNTFFVGISAQFAFFHFSHLPISAFHSHHCCSFFFFFFCVSILCLFLWQYSICVCPVLYWVCFSY